MNLDPKFTIITSTFNAEKFLAVTADSLRKQSFKNFEWIIVDGGSSDLTVEIIKKNADLVSKWISESDQGIYDAWNKGLNFARGEWISFLGAGDRYFPDALEKYENKIQSTVGVEFISSKIQLVSEYGNILRDVGEEFSMQQHKKFMTIAHVGAMHKKTLFERFGFFDSKYKYAGDYDFFMRCGESFQASFLNLITATMIVGGASNNVETVIETYEIQRSYNINSYICVYRLLVALIKKPLRAFFRGY